MPANVGMSGGLGGGEAKGTNFKAGYGLEIVGKDGGRGTTRCARRHSLETRSGTSGPPPRDDGLAHGQQGTDHFLIRLLIVDGGGEKIFNVNVVKPGHALHGPRG